MIKEQIKIKKIQNQSKESKASEIMRSVIENVRELKIKQILKRFCWQLLFKNIVLLGAFLCLDDFDYYAEIILL